MAIVKSKSKLDLRMTKGQMLILFVSILSSFVVFLDGSVVSIALPAIIRELGGGLVLQQWVTDAYLITLGALILAAGSLSDIFGRRKVMVIGLIGFAITSLLCAAAPTGVLLITARALQGVAGALLVPSSLALIISSFSGTAQAKAIGSWTAWTGISFVLGPLIGGLMVDLLSWRFVFAINIAPIAIALWLLTLIPNMSDVRRKTRVDILGIVLGAFGLGGTVFSLIEQSRYGWNSSIIYLPFIMGIVSLIAFVWHERRTKQPMVPLELFQVRNFSMGNVATFFIYAALSLQGFLLVILLQQVAGYSALEAGLAPIPITFILFLLSSRFGALSGKYGPRLFMTVGPLVAACGIATFFRVSPHAYYLAELFPGIILFGLGLAITVAPLTSAILGSIQSTQAGIGSAINNAVARIAGLLAIAAIGIFVGVSMNLDGFKRAIFVCVLLLVIGGLISFVGIRNETTSEV